METKELERIVNEYCDSIRESMLKDVRHFESNWNGFHVRALGIMTTDFKHEGVKKAMRQIKSSQAYYQMSV